MKPRRAQRCLQWDYLEDRICQSAGSTLTVAGAVPSAITNGSLSPAQLRLDELYQEQVIAVNNAKLAAQGFPPPSTKASVTATPQLDKPNNVRLMLQYQQQAATLHPSVIFLGDSVSWAFANQAGEPAWNSTIAPLNALQFGVPGDTTQNLLWRVQNGDLASHPKVAVVEIGLNNFGTYNTVNQTVAGVKAVVETVRTISPTTKVLLLGIFPTATPDNWTRGLEYSANLQLARMSNGNTIRFSNPGWKMVGPGGSLGANLSHDMVHPSAQGYAVVAAALLPTLEQMLAQPSPVVAAARGHR
jgi:lysophospholipase L1-like esterase